MPLNLLSEIDGDQGFSLKFKLSPPELTRLCEIVRNHWLEIIYKNNPKLAEKSENLPMSEYHTISGDLDHDTIWPQTIRMLSASEVNELRSMDFFTRLTSEFGPIDISDELCLGHEEVYWRLVRPDQPSDFGPLHADKWFWDVRNFKIRSDQRRIKIWMALFVEPGKNGLRLCPSSHKKTWDYQPVYKHGSWKPEFNEQAHHLNIELMNTKPGDTVIFHDELLHGGAMNLGQSTRVSLEFTMLTKKDNSC